MALGHCHILSATIRGVVASLVEVEVDVSSGIPSFQIVGMPDAAVQESKERVRAAIKAADYTMPVQRIVVNLAPSAMKKSGSGFDLPIAVGILAATGQIDGHPLEKSLLVGELSLEGQVRPVAGILAYARCAQDKGLSLISAFDSSQIVPIKDLVYEALDSLGSLRSKNLRAVASSRTSVQRKTLDFKDIAGHEMAKRALQIAAAGNHGLLMMGPPGSGKTMLASRLPSILPPLSDDEILETAQIHSVVGNEIQSILAGIRPFRSPHHSSSRAGLVGGGTPVRPGEISLAHNGILFLDELAEFSPSTLQGIRQPMETGEIVITRADGNITLPARFNLIAASNPCPCGFFGDTERPCTCSLSKVHHYQNRIGGPLMDRVDLHIDVGRVKPREVLSAGSGLSSDEMREGVIRARVFQDWRNENELGRRKKRRSSQELMEECKFSVQDREFFEKSATAYHMSGRAIVRTLAVARTIADMNESEHVTRENICEALTFRLREGVGML
jgi:magnesium chelatase family protein